MEQEISITDKNVFVTLSGRVETQQAAGLKEKLLAMVESGHRNFTVDVGNVEYIDSAGLGVLVAVRNSVIDDNGAVVVKNLNGKLKRLFELTRLVEIFTVPETE